MPRDNYDPQKAHEYYMRTRELKGRQPGSSQTPTTKARASAAQVASAQQKVSQIQDKLNRLRQLLHEKVAAASKESSTPKKSTQADKLKDRQDSKEYYDKHKQQIKNDRASKAKSSGGGSSSSTKTAADMSADELRTAIRNTVAQLKQAITEAKRLRGG